MKKKITSLALALTMAVGMAVPAFAAGYNEPIVGTIPPVLEPQVTKEGNNYTLSSSVNGLSMTMTNVASVENLTLCFDGMESETTIYHLSQNSTVSYTNNSDVDYCDVSYSFYSLVNGTFWSEFGDTYDINPRMGETVTGFGPFTERDMDTVIDSFCSYNFSNSLGAFKYAFVVDNGALSYADYAVKKAPAEPETPAESETPATPETPAEPEVPAAPATYTVKKGDTLGQIALNYYGSYKYYKALSAANADVLKKSNYILYVGMELNLPEKLGETPKLAAQTPAEGEKLYTVQLGDTLGTIAYKTYGNTAMYKAIYERNTDRLANPNMIYEGQVIVLPAK